MQLAEQGVMGLLLFVALYITMMITAQQMFHRCKDPFYKHLVLINGCILGMIGTLICVSDLIETDKIGFMFYLCVGSLLHVALRMRKYESGEIRK
jgi:predicted tellurium resistance membrane protein TerC